MSRTVLPKTGKAAKAATVGSDAMDSEMPDIDATVLAALCSNRNSFTDLINSGFRPELLTTPWAQVIGSVLLGLSRGQTAIDFLQLRSAIEEQGLLFPEVAELLEKMLLLPPPTLDFNLKAYLNCLNDRWSRRQLLEVAASIDFYARNRLPAQPSITDFTASLISRLIEIQMDRLHTTAWPLDDSKLSGRINHGCE